VPSFLELEKAASRLRQKLRIARLPELKVLCVLSFFRTANPDNKEQFESYVREFLPPIASAARVSNPAEFLPDEVKALDEFIRWLESFESGVVPFGDLYALRELSWSISDRISRPSPPRPEKERGVVVTCLFAEHYPYLELPPRGRLLEMTVTAERIADKADRDDIVIRNPVDTPNDPFLEQARLSIEAARDYLTRRYGLSEKRRYRFDFIVMSTVARFTGDSLGVAFAAGAIAAIEKIEVLPERIDVSSDAAFSGALTGDGWLIPVDPGALRLKINCAFRSNLKYLVVPREHLTEAWKTVSGLEAQYPGRKLELVGADTLASVAGDHRLLPTRRDSAAAYLARKAARAGRSTWVEAPALIAIAVILALLIMPDRFMPWFDDNPLYATVNAGHNSLEVYNHDSVMLWYTVFDCPLVDNPSPTTIAVGDLDGDKKNEVLFMPVSSSDCPERGRFYCYSFEGQPLFTRNCAILNRFPGDTAGVLYDIGEVGIVDAGDDPIIYTSVQQEIPARKHIRLWSATGDSLGWYINWGHGSFRMAKDLDGDGRLELLFLAYNNPMHCAALFALRTDSCSGFSPPYKDGPGYDWMTRGEQYGYVVFPVTDVGMIDLPTYYNGPGSHGIVAKETGTMEVFINESGVGGAECAVIYTLDGALWPTRAVCNDAYWKRRDQLVSEGRLPAAETSEYQHGLRDAVLHWTDSGWVSEGKHRTIAGTH
jgi:hypothetical protein